MKLLTLHIKNFISILDVKLDFQKFKPGVFLISGPTGSGKSTLLDAIHWALYGVTLNQNRNQVHKTIFSDYAKPTDTTNVELEFEQDGLHYKVNRGMNKDGYTSIRFHTPDYIYDKVREANAAIEKTLGLSSKQFDQMVMLEQGNFSKFLLTDSRDRAALLRNVFDTQLFQNLELSLKSRVDNYKEEIEAQNNLELALLHGEMLDTIKMRVETADATMQKQEAVLDTARKDLIDLQSKLPIIHRYESEKQIWEEAQRQLDLLEETKPEIEQLKQRQEIYKQHRSSYLQYNKCITTKEAIDAANTKILQLTGTLNGLESMPSIQETSLEIQEKIYKLREKYADFVTYERLITEINDIKSSLAAENSELEIARTDLLSDTAERDTLQETYNSRKESEQALATWEALEKDISDHKDALAEVQQLKADLEPNYVQALKYHLLSICDSGTCPICGSAYKADIAQTPDISFNEFQELQARELSINAWLDSHPLSEKPVLCGELTSEKLSLKLKLIEDKCAADNRIISACEKAIAAKEGLLSNRKEDLANLQKPEGTRESLANAIQTLTDRVAEIEALERKVQEIREQRIQIQTQIDSEQERIQKYQADAQAEGYSLNEADYADMLIHIQDIIDYDNNQEVIISRIQQYAAAIEKYSAVSKPVQEVQMTAFECEAKIREGNIKVQEAITILSDIKNNIDNDKKLIEQVEACQKKRDYLLPKYKEMSYLYTQISGKNNSRLSLENFVLHRQLEWILDTSNRFLATLSNNQFVLNIRWEGTGRAQGGLEISIQDNMSGKARPAQTFSGGELFILSLSLSLGLMSSIDALFSGISLDILLIDEGFGTLDPDCLSRVMNALQEIRSISSVGIISHVQELIDSIPQGFLVTKGIRGTEVQQFSNGI